MGLHMIELRVPVELGPRPAGLAIGWIAKEAGFENLGRTIFDDIRVALRDETKRIRDSF